MTARTGLGPLAAEATLNIALGPPERSEEAAE